MGKIVNSIVGGTIAGAAVSVALLAVTIPLNAAVYAGLFAQECLEARFTNSKTTNLNGRLKEKSMKEYLLPGSHSRIIHGTFDLGSGLEMEVIDVPVVTEGNFLPRMHNLVEGQNYNFTVYGSEKTGYKLVSAEQVK